MKASWPWLMTLALLTTISTSRPRAEEAVGLEAGYFMPSDKTFRSFYGNGWTGGLSGRLRTRQGFGLFFSADYFQEQRSYRSETFQVAAYPVSVQLLYYLHESPRLSPFLAVGMAGIVAQERNLSTGKSTVLNTDPGLIGTAGVEFGPRRWTVRPYFRWSLIQEPTRENFSGLNLSGYAPMLGVNYCFGQPRKALP